MANKSFGGFCISNLSIFYELNSAALIPSWLASTIESQRRAFRGTMTIIDLFEGNRAWYWYSIDFPNPVGRLTNTSFYLLHVIIAFCIGFSLNVRRETAGNYLWTQS